MNSPTIIITTEFENPAMASSTVSIRHNSRAISEHSATMSERTLPDTKRMAATARIIKVAVIGAVSFFYNAKIGKISLWQQSRHKLILQDYCPVSICKAPSLSNPP